MENNKGLLLQPLCPIMPHYPSELITNALPLCKAACFVGHFYTVHVSILYIAVHTVQSPVCMYGGGWMKSRSQPSQHQIHQIFLSTSTIDHRHGRHSSSTELVLKPYECVMFFKAPTHYHTSLIFNIGSKFNFY